MFLHMQLALIMHIPLHFYDMLLKIYRRITNAFQRNFPFLIIHPSSVTVALVKGHA